jgi:hypothetical protein
MPAMSAAIYGSDRANGADRRRLGYAALNPSWLRCAFAAVD